MGFFSGLGQQQIDRVPHVKLNEMGTERLRKSQPGSQEFIVLSSIKEIEPCTIDELSKKLGRDQEKTRYILRAYKSYIQIL